MTRPIFARGMGTSPAGPPGKDGLDGTDGLPGVNAVANDTATASYIGTPSSQTATALSASIVAAINNPTSDVRAALDALYGTPPGPAVPTLAESGPGWRIAAGTQNVWRTDKANAANQLVEVALLGNSTLWGAGSPTGGIVPRIRQRSIADGHPDGGRGVGSPRDTAESSGESLAPMFSQSGKHPTTIGNAYDFLLTDQDLFDNVGDEVTYQGYGTRCRLYYTRQAVGADFSYSVDGGSAVTVAGVANKTSDTRIGCVEITGLAPTGVHKVRCINKGQPPTLPVIFQIDAGYNPSGVPGNTVVSYKATSVTASGEGLPSVAVSGSNPNPSNWGVSIYRSGNSLITSFKVYRSDNGGAYGLVGSTPNTGGGTLVSFSDTNAVAPGVAPPTTDTSGLVPTDGEMKIVAEWVKDAGIVYHKHAVVGATAVQFFSDDTGNNANTLGQAALGLMQGPVGTPPDPDAAPRPPWRNLSLAVWALGINEQQGGAPASQVRASAEKFKRLCDSAGCDAVLVVEHFKRSIGSANAASFAAAVQQVATEFDMTIVYFDTALDVAEYPVVSDPHLDQAGYDIEADFLWDNVLSK